MIEELATGVSADGEELERTAELPDEGDKLWLPIEIPLGTPPRRATDGARLYEKLRCAHAGSKRQSHPRRATPGLVQPAGFMLGKVTKRSVG